MKLMLLAGIPLVSLMIGCAGKKPPVEEAKKTEVKKEAPAKVAAPIKEAKSANLIKVEDLLAELMAQKVYFDFDKSELTEKAKEILAKVGKILSQPMEKEVINILIEGHTDEMGTGEYNIALGEKRALKVKEYLESYGVSVAQLKIISFGEEKKAKEGHDEQSNSLNRRAELKAESVKK